MVLGVQIIYKLIRTEILFLRLFVIVEILGSRSLDNKSLNNEMDWYNVYSKLNIKNC